MNAILSATFNRPDCIVDITHTFYGRKIGSRNIQKQKTYTNSRRLVLTHKSAQTRWCRQFYGQELLKQIRETMYKNMSY